MGNDSGNRLEPPRLSFRRKKADAEQAAPEEAPARAPEPAEEPTEVIEPVPEPEPQPEPRPEPTEVLEPVEAETAREKPARTSLLPRTPKARTPEARTPEAKTPKVPRPPKEPKPEKAERAPRPARERRTPPVSAGALGGHPAAAVTGLVVGLFMVLAVWGIERVSQAARGTPTLGRAGFPLLVAIFILAVALGSVLFRWLGTPSPTSSSFLGTGLVSVLSILFLTDHVDSFAGSALVVLIAVASFVLARWVSVRYIGD